MCVYMCSVVWDKPFWTKTHTWTAPCTYVLNYSHMKTRWIFINNMSLWFSKACISHKCTGNRPHIYTRTCRSVGRAVKTQPLKQSKKPEALMISTLPVVSDGLTLRYTRQHEEVKGETMAHHTASQDCTNPLISNRSICDRGVEEMPFIYSLRVWQDQVRLSQNQATHTHTG